LPRNFNLDGPATAWFDTEGEMKQLRAAARFSRQFFHATFPAGQWCEVPVPEEYATVMDLQGTVPKEEMTCYLGQLQHKPAYLFWSDVAESAMLVVDY
jgi:hypothetical protein